MKVSNEDKILIGAGVVGACGLGYLYWRKKQAEKESPTDYSPEPMEPKANPKPTQGATLDKNKLLKKGSKGLEVRELQRLLGVGVDGDFGNLTETALLNAKGVTSISINAFSSKVKAQSANPTALTTPKVGQKIMAIKNGMSIFNAQKNANVTYTNSGTKPFFGSSFDYGDHLGTYVSLKSDGEYLILREGAYYFVNRNFVTPY